MELQFVIDNRIRRERLSRAVKDMVDEEFNNIIQKENWNTVAILSNLCFWDERRIVITQKRKRKDIKSALLIEEAIIDTIDKAFIPFRG